jgi:NAD-dependent dihydropyrimidine dehydrogenase PreA subunit
MVATVHTWAFDVEESAMVRKIVRIDEELCDGCGLCVPSCAEGAIKVIDGKARLVADKLCDGIGACLGHCPRGAISIEERDAAPFEEVASHAVGPSVPPHRATPPFAGCPGSRVMQFAPRPAAKTVDAEADGASESALRQWPVQMSLVPPTAPYLRGADILLAADCVPFAYADFHRRLLAGRAVLVGCPKLDDVEPYVAKLAEIMRLARPRSLKVAIMEVPCCSGLVRVAQMAAMQAEWDRPVEAVVIGIGGEVLGEV